MSKYTYEPVEHFSDLDITGVTTYYLFEEGVGHKECRIREYTIDSLETLMVGRFLLTREEKPWWERIPEKGVLCNYSRCNILKVIVGYDEENFTVLDVNDNEYDVNALTPLNNEQIKEFLQEE